MLPVDWKAAIGYASLVDIAYGVSPSVDYDPATIAVISKAGFRFLHTLYGDDLATDISPHIGNVVSYGFLAVSDDGELVAVIRGTETVWEWVHDASFLMVPCCVHRGQGLTEDGFSSVYKSLRVDRPGAAPSALAAIGTALSTSAAKSVSVTGHSLGAALATLLALDVGLNTACRSPTCYTFASPRVGDHLFAAGYNASVPMTYRVANRQDLVTLLPPVLPLPYEHVNTLYALNPSAGNVAATIPCMHYLSTYLWLMDQLAQTGHWPLNPACKSLAAGVPAPQTAGSAT